MTFSYWSFKQFDNTLSDLEEALTGNILLASPSLKKKPIAPIASTSLEVSFSPEIPIAPIASTSLEVSFNFPQKGAKLYIGCTYQISWQSSATIHSLGTALVDAGTKELVGPIASGLAKEYTIEKDLQNLKWNVGVVVPGAYYITVSKINGAEAEFRSEVFDIHKAPAGFDANKSNTICRNLSE